VNAGPSLPLDQVIDRCIDDITAGRRSVADCLAAFPEHREDLAPLLMAAAAVRSLPPVPDRTPDRARRAAFMNELARTPQQSRHRGPRLALPRFDGLRGRVLAFASVAAPATAVAVLALALMLGRGSTPASASTLTVFAGSVEQERDGTWQLIADGDTLREGARLRTTADGRAMLTFPDGSTATLAPTTELVLERVRVNGVRDVILDQRSGRLWNDVVADARIGATYVVRTNGVVTTVTGTVFETAVTDGETAVTTAAGVVSVAAGSDAIEVARGESVRATGERIQELAVTPPTAAVEVDAPYTASLIASDGAATGARPDGVTFSQIAGATTTDPAAGPQRIDLLRPTPGDYTLVLRPYADGGGVVVIAVAGEVLTIPVDGPDDIKIALRVAVIDGRPAIEVLEREDVAGIIDAVRERVVETRRTTEAVSVATRRAVASATAARAATTATPEPTTEARESGARDDRPGTPDATAAPDAGRDDEDDDDRRAESDDAGLSPERLPGLLATQTPALNAARARLRSALASRDADALARVVAAMLADDSALPREDATRLLLAEGLRNGIAAARLRALATADGAVSERLRTALGEAALGDLAPTIDALLNGTRLLAPTATPTPEHSRDRRDATATPTAERSRDRRGATATRTPERSRDRRDPTATPTPTPSPAPVERRRLIPRVGDDGTATSTPTATPRARGGTSRGQGNAADERGRDDNRDRDDDEAGGGNGDSDDDRRSSNAQSLTGMRDDLSVTSTGDLGTPVIPFLANFRLAVSVDGAVQAGTRGRATADDRGLDRPWRRWIQTERAGRSSAPAAR